MSQDSTGERWPQHTEFALIRYMDITDRRNFSVPEDSTRRCLDASGEWFKNAANFVTNTCAAAKPPVSFIPTAKMVGLKLRKLGNQYSNTIQGWNMCHDTLREAYDDCRSAANTPEICRVPQSEPGMGSESELRRMLASERKSRMEAWGRLEKVVKIQNNEEKADALDKYWRSANPRMDMTKPVDSAELVRDVGDHALIKHLFRAAKDGDLDRCILLEEMAQDLRQSKKGNEHKTGKLICDTLVGQRNISQLGIHDVITQLAQSPGQLNCPCAYRGGSEAGQSAPSRAPAGLLRKVLQGRSEAYRSSGGCRDDERHRA